MRPLALDLCTGKGGWARGLKAAGWSVIGVDVKDWGNPYVDRLVLRDVRELKGSDFPGVKLVCASPPCQEFSYRSFPFKRCRELRDTVPPDKSIWEACVRIASEIGCPLILENVRGAQGTDKGVLHPEWFMGKSAWHYGPFHFWGDTPILTHPGKAPQKGFGRVKVLENPSDPWGGFGGSSYQSRGKKGTLNAKRDKELHGGFVGEMDRVKPVYRGKVKTDSGAFGWNKSAVQDARINKKGPAMSKNRDKYRGSTPMSASRGMGSKSNARAEWSAKAAMIPEELAEWIGRVFHPDGI